jgi:hypothetical protein
MGENEIEDITVGLELHLMTQEQVVSEFRELVSKDLSTAAIKYYEFAQKLEEVASGGNAQVRSLTGGPDSSSRAELVNVLVGNYASASDDVKEKVLELAVAPLLRDNSFYVKLAVVRMKNPYVIADIIRKYPIFNPGADFYEEDLLSHNNVSSAGSLQAWLNKFGDSNFYAAMAIALQRSNPTDTGSVVAANELLFEGAAHIVASHHDTIADRKTLQNPNVTKSELLEKYRSSFVDEFIELVRQKSAEANWLKLDSTNQR